MPTNLVDVYIKWSKAFNQNGLTRYDCRYKILFRNRGGVTHGEPTVATEFNVQAEIHRLTLQLLEFYRITEGDIEAGVNVETEIQWSLGLQWISYLSTIGVELGVTLNAPAHFKLKAVFRAIIEPTSPKQDD